MIRSVGVVGAGTMGRGIAQLCAQSGFSAVLFDSAPGAAAAGLRAASEGIAKGLARGKLSREKAEKASAALSAAGSLEALAPCDVLIEAVAEDLAVKRALFERLDGLAKPDALLVTNTSSLRVADVMARVGRPGRALGIHFFNPAPVMRLVELVRAPRTEEAAFERARAFVEALGKTAVEVKDSPGFIVNRVVRRFYLEGLRLAGQGAGSFAEIDAALKAAGLPMGPFELMDLIGLDVNLAISRAIFEALGRPERLRPHAIQQELVGLGAHGRKAGRGFYLYGEGGPDGENPEASALLPARRAVERSEIARRVLAAVASEAELALEEGAASREGIDTAVKLAMNFPFGPFEWRESASKA